MLYLTTHYNDMNDKKDNRNIRKHALSSNMYYKTFLMYINKKLALNLNWKPHKTTSFNLLYS